MIPRGAFMGTPPIVQCQCRWSVFSSVLPAAPMGSSSPAWAAAPVPRDRFPPARCACPGEMIPRGAFMGTPPIVQCQCRWSVFTKLLALAPMGSSFPAWAAPKGSILLCMGDGAGGIISPGHTACAGEKRSHRHLGETIPRHRQFYARCTVLRLIPVSLSIWRRDNPFCFNSLSTASLCSLGMFCISTPLSRPSSSRITDFAHSSS